MDCTDRMEQLKFALYQARLSRVLDLLDRCPGVSVIVEVELDAISVRVGVIRGSSAIPHRQKAPARCRRPWFLLLTI
jgi:hypothetical protein